MKWILAAVEMLLVPMLFLLIVVTPFAVVSILLKMVFNYDINPQWAWLCFIATMGVCYFWQQARMRSKN